VALTEISGGSIPSSIVRGRYVIANPEPRFADDRISLRAQALGACDRTTRAQPARRWERLLTSKQGSADRGMEIADLITPRSIVAQLRVTNKKQALQELAKRAAVMTDTHERTIYDVL